MPDLSRVEQWFTMMEKLGEADMPMELNGIILTPRQLLQHAQLDDDTWKQIKDKI